MLHIVVGLKNFQNIADSLQNKGVIANSPFEIKSCNIQFHYLYFVEIFRKKLQSY